MRNLVLVGFMGTGKSAVGRLAAERLGFRFCDSDSWIERRERRTIAALFREEGEEAFRLKEEAAIAHLSRRTRQVLSTGGGALTRPANVQALKRTGVLICLEARPEVILQRTLGRDTRPLLAGADDPLDRIRTLLAARRDAYAQADARLDTSDLSLEEAVEKTIELWRERGGDTASQPG